MSFWSKIQDFILGTPEPLDLPAPEVPEEWGSDIRHDSETKIVDPKEPTLGEIALQEREPEPKVVSVAPRPEHFREPKPLLNFLSSKPAIITNVDTTSDEDMLDKAYQKLDMKQYEVEQVVDYATVDENEKIFSLKEVASMMATFEILIRKSYEKTEIPPDQTKSQRPTASRARSARRKVNSRRKIGKSSR